MRSLFTLSLALLVLTFSGCGEAWWNLTAPLGGDRPGERGSVGVIVLNNTPYRAVFTLGSYDQSVPDAEPDFDQFVLDGNDVLDGNENGGLLSFDCARVFSIGGRRLLDLIDTENEDVQESALIEGVEFFDTSAAAEPQSQGLARPFEVLLGVDFPCNALLIFKLEVDASGSSPFRIDYELIPSSDSR